LAHPRLKGSNNALPLHRLPGTALRGALGDGYGLAELKGDVLAGVVVGVVALPLAMALAIGVGAPPQHGLYTAIVAGFFVALLGGSRTQVSGPTAAFIVILAPIHAKFGMAGLLLSGLLGGFILIFMGVLRLGKLIQFIPHPVTTGFTAGIATVIATLQLKDLLGLRWEENPAHFLERVLLMFEVRSTVTLSEVSIGLFTLALLLVIPRFTKRIPAPLIALPLAAFLAVLLQSLLAEFSVATIANRFHTTAFGQVFHGIPQLPPLPIVPWNATGPGGQAFDLGLDEFRELLSGALAIAMLGAIESLLSAVVADGMARTKHDPDAELISLGIGNVITPFFGGIPATGAIARTATNVRAGARSPIAAMVHALVVLLAVLILAPLLGFLPMASLAALLLLVAWNMSEAPHFVHTLRVAPKSDVAVLLTCYGLTVAVDMVVGVSVGMVLAALLFMRRMAEVTHTQLVSEGHPQIPEAMPSGVSAYEISGPLFFGAAQRAMAALEIVSQDTKAVVLLMDGVHVMDATGLVALESALSELGRHKCAAILCGVQVQPRALLERSHTTERQGVFLRQSPSEAFELAALLADASTGQSISSPAAVFDPLVPKAHFQPPPSD
jgi:sulfate permease, SulP family